MTLEGIQADVEILYQFRDDFFQTHDANEAHLKDEEVKKQLDALIISLDSLKETIPKEKRGEFHFLKGKALNVVSDYSKRAEDELGRATKFNFPAAWNELGECQFKKGDLISAKMCFEKALQMEQKPVYLRNMSMLMRSLPWDSAAQREENIEKGFHYARDAIKLDVKDGHSWLVLGNSYLASFFTVEAKLDILKKCKSAYIKAEEDQRASNLPELHFSKFQVAWYEEEYSNSLKCLQRAMELEPTWQDPKSKYEESYKFLVKLSHLVHSKGQLSQRKLASLIEGINPSQLGPYKDGGTALTSGEKPIPVRLGLLAEGNNEKRIVQGKVVCTLMPDSGLPFAFCIVDSDGTCRGVTVYNWASGCGVKIGDSVAILAPVLKRHSFSDEKIKDFFSIRVAIPLMLVVNKRCVTTNQILTSQVISQKKED